MRGTKAKTRLAILDAAYGLFWRQGFLRVSMDEIAGRAEVTKRTLYQHFRSKDDLIAEALAYSSALAIRRLTAFRLPPTADAFVVGLFLALEKWAATPRYSGAGFTRAVMELADLRGHPARAIARRHKATVENWMGKVFAESGVKHSAKRAREVALLMEGAMALMLIHGDRSYANAAAQAARSLVADR